MTNEINYQWEEFESEVRLEALRISASVFLGLCSGIDKYLRPWYALGMKHCAFCGQQADVTVKGPFACVIALCLGCFRVCYGRVQ